MGKGTAVKVKEINIERGSPTVDTAVGNLVNGLSTAKRAGFKAVVLIHGYGSSGTGGAIKAAAKEKLKDRALSGIIKDAVGGEDWLNHSRDFMGICPQLTDYSRYVEGNRGVTVILLK